VNDSPRVKLSNDRRQGRPDLEDFEEVESSQRENLLERTRSLVLQHERRSSFESLQRNGRDDKFRGQRAGDFIVAPETVGVLRRSTRASRHSNQHATICARLDSRIHDGDRLFPDRVAYRVSSEFHSAFPMAETAGYRGLLAVNTA
jgi:hypothetical protein